MVKNVNVPTKKKKLKSSEFRMQATNFQDNGESENESGANGQKCQPTVILYFSEVRWNLWKCAYFSKPIRMDATIVVANTHKHIQLSTPRHQPNASAAIVC